MYTPHLQNEFENGFDPSGEVIIFKSPFRMEVCSYNPLEVTSHPMTNFQSIY
jgi:hypothetical protein